MENRTKLIAFEEEGRASGSSGRSRGRKEDRVDSWRTHKLLVGGTTMDKGNDGNSELDLEYIRDSLQTD